MRVGGGVDPLPEHQVPSSQRQEHHVFLVPDLLNLLHAKALNPKIRLDPKPQTPNPEP